MNTEHITPGLETTARRVTGLRRLAILDGGADRTPYERARLLPLAQDAEIVRVAAREETCPDGRRRVRLAPASFDPAGAAPPDLLIVPRGPRDLRTRLFGSDAERIVRGADHPVLVTRLPARAPYARALVATDFSEVSGDALRLALSILALHGEEPWVLHAYDTSYSLVLRQVNAPPERLLAYQGEARDEAEHRMEQFLEQFRPAEAQVRAICRSGEPVDVIRRCVRQLQTELLVIGKHAQSGAGRPLMGTTAERCVRNAPCDLLVVPQRPPTVH